MIADSPNEAAAGVEPIADKVAVFIAAARAATVGGITWQEFGELLAALVRLVAGTLDAVSSLSGAEKRAMVLEAVGLLFDAVASRAVPFPVSAIWILVRPAVRNLVLAIAAGLLEQTLPLLRASK